MDLRKALLAVRFMGASNLFRSILYALKRDWSERSVSSSPISGPPLSPGTLQEFSDHARGGRFHFEGADLDVTFLTPDLVRLSWTPGVAPVPYALVDRDWPSVSVEHDIHPGRGQVTTAALAVVVQADGTVEHVSPEGEVIRTVSPPTRRGEQWTERASLPDEAHVYGLGERAAPLNLRGETYQMWNTDPGGSYGRGADPLYLTVPLYLVHTADRSYLLFYENPFPGVVRLYKNSEVVFDGGMLRSYFTVGSIAQVLERYTTLTGRPPLPPRWSLGFHQSRWGYASQEEIREVAEAFRNQDLPLHAIHLDIDHMAGYRVFTLNERGFPELDALASELREHNVRLITILDPGVKVDRRYALFRDGLARGAFVRSPDRRGVQVAPVWPGWAAYPDFTHPRAREWWGEHYPLLLEKGVRGFWHDMNEPAAFAGWGSPTLPLNASHHMEGRGGDHREAHNLYALLMAQAGYEALERLMPDQRPWILSRSGWAGLQRYAWTWTGDTESSWHMLRQTIPTVLNLGLSGIPFSGPDIGGFSGAPDAELFTRWFQLAAFLPFFRNHAALGTPRREPWAFGEPHLKVFRRYLKLRQRLLPYLYTLAWEASRSGAPLVRPVFWEHPDDQRLFGVDDAFLLGPHLLIAPALEPGISARSVCLPPGSWYHVWDDAILSGNETRDLPVTPGQIPVLARAGAVIPMEREDELHLHVYAPPAGSGHGRVYSDSGDGSGDWRLDRFAVYREENELTLQWAQKGEYLFPYKQVSLFLHGFQALSALVDGEEVPFDGTRLAVGYFERVAFRAPPPGYNTPVKKATT